MATKTYVVTGNDVASGAKTTMTYVPKVARAFPSKAATAPGTPTYSKNDFSTTPSTSSPVPPEVVSSGNYSSGAAKGGASGQDSSEAFAPNASGLKDSAIGERDLDEAEDWTRSFSGMAVEAFESEVAELLMKPLDPDDIEIKPGKWSAWHAFFQ